MKLHTKESVMHKGFDVDKIHEQLLQRGWSLGQLGVQSGISYNTLWRIVQRESSPTIPIAAAIAEGLGVSLDYLVGLTDNPDQHVIEDKTKEERELLIVAKGLSAMRQAELVSVARVLKESQDDVAYEMTEWVEKHVDMYQERADARTQEDRTTDMLRLFDQLEKLIVGIGGSKWATAFRGLLDSGLEEDSD